MNATSRLDLAPNLPVRIILIFATTHCALAAERVLLERRVWHELLPPPRGLTLSCGLCLRVRQEDFALVRKILAEGQTHFAQAYRMPDRVDGPYLPIG